MATVDVRTTATEQGDQSLIQVNDPRTRVPLVLGDNNFTTVTDKVTQLALRKTPSAWYIAFSFSLTLLSLLFVTLVYLLTTGVGVWGNNNTVSWGSSIIGEASCTAPNGLGVASCAISV